MKDIFMNIIVPMLVFAAVGGLFGLLLGWLSQVFAVQIDERVEKVTEMLPGYNCGACGSPGCAQFAEKVVSGEADPVLCKPGKQDMRDKIKAYLHEATKNAQNNTESKTFT
ncbi:MAG TPA: (Fe-S)-binding protein [Bacilli bacterium]|jgi:electron transport complex protein RnfB|nr:(Fe-S)-binding protein [Bacilli bacterium]HPZ28000.1 (Fe-S)-binding protein [Bacilli bacterium]HQC90361.1 (Fe-S)-binding protein [Bacilli bacterium]